jgi:diguanylate cyclase (GGDEF)-like protein/PAS domain S-box-containing protein
VVRLAPKRSVLREEPSSTHTPGTEDRALLDALLRRSRDGIVLTERRSRRILEASDSFCALTGYTHAQLVGRSSIELCLGTEKGAGGDAEGSAGLHEGRLRRSDGEVRLIEYSHTVLDDGEHLLTVLRDITDRRRVEAAARRAASIVEHTDDAIIAETARGRITEWNAGAERLLGYTASEAVGRPLRMVIPSEQLADIQAVLDRVLSGEAIKSYEMEGVRKDGSRVDISVTVSPMRDEHGVIVGASSIVRDISDRKRVEQELRHHADHDSLTGLLNRRRLDEELTREVALSARHPEIPGALLVADLDNFKLVNDTLGHRAGDELIKAVARLLRSRVRASDVLGRLGGDEFAVLLPHTDLPQAQVVAESLRMAVSELQTHAGGRPVRVSMSVGVAPLGGGRSGEDSLALADIAMYAAKERGRDRVAVLDTEHERTRLTGRLGLSQRTRAAIEEGRLELHAQRIVDVATQRADRHELLLRVRDGGGLLLPASFIAAAEREGMIKDIDRWVVGEAVALLAADRADGDVYHVNLSAISICDHEVLALIERAIRDAEVDPGRLVFEFTETAALVDIVAARAFARGLQEIGCACALDDFGAGFSSFTHLKQLPVDFLKIDGGYIKPLPGSETDRVLVKALVDVAHRLGKRTIAEHVGSGPALMLLRDYGVDFAQGYALGMPRPRRPRDPVSAAGLF